MFVDLLTPGIRKIVASRHCPDPIRVERDLLTGSLVIENTRTGAGCGLPLTLADGYAGIVCPALAMLVAVSPHSIWPRMGTR